MRMRVVAMIGISVLVAPLSLRAQVPEYDRVPRGFNKHALTVDACAAGRGSRSEWQQRVHRIDPIPTYGWVWVTLDAVRNLEWPRAAARVERARWNGVLTPAQRDSVRSFEGTPVVIDGYLLPDQRRHFPVVAAGLLEKSSSNCRSSGTQEDWHFLMAEHPGDPRTDAVVVTVTSRMRQDGWDLAKLDEIARRGLMVRVWGWLLFDQENPPEVLAQGNSSKGRITPWAVHPIVEIEVFHDRETLVPLAQWGTRRRISQRE